MQGQRDFKGRLFTQRAFQFPDGRIHWEKKNNTTYTWGTLGETADSH